MIVNMYPHHLIDYGHKKILIVDDDLDLSEYFRELFLMEDFEVLSCKNGHEALQALQVLKDEDLPDLILLDYMMPVMDGEAFSKAKQLDPRLEAIPVVLMTANGDMVSVMDKVEANAYVDKPLDLNMLMSVVKEVFTPKYC